MSDELKLLYNELYENGYSGDINICHTENLIYNGVEKLIPKNKKIQTMQKKIEVGKILVGYPTPSPCLSCRVVPPI